MGVPFTATYRVSISDTIETCPQFLTVLGATMGYIGYLEIFATLVLACPLIFLKFVKPKPQRSAPSLLSIIKSADGSRDELIALRDDVNKLFEHLQLENSADTDVADRAKAKVARVQVAPALGQIET